jgi:hypothetical protein
MDWLVITSVVALGFVIGLLIGWFVNEDQSFTATGLTTSISVLSGAGVLGFFHYVSPNGPTREVWLYPIGILAGLLTAPFFDIFYNALYEDEKSGRGVRALVRTAQMTQRAIIKLALRNAKKGSSRRKI